MRVAGSVIGAELPRVFTRIRRMGPGLLGYGFGMAGGKHQPYRISLEAVFELLGQIFDVVWWPIFDVHAEV